MDENVELILDDAKEHMDKSIEHFKAELVKIRAGKASPTMVDGVTVEYYGSPTPLNQVATVSASDARTLTISPWEKKMVPIIAKAILDANLGFNPQNDGEIVRIPIPTLTEERRKQLVKQAKSEGENAKIAIRKIRQNCNHELKKLKDENVSEDQIKSGEGKVQELTNSYGSKVDDILKEKEAQIMTV